MAAIRTEWLDRLLIVVLIGLMSACLYHLMSRAAPMIVTVTRLTYEDRPIGILTREADCARILADIRNDRRHRYICRTGRP